MSQDPLVTDLVAELREMLRDGARELSQAKKQVDRRTVSLQHTTTEIRRLTRIKEQVEGELSALKRGIDVMKRRREALHLAIEQLDVCSLCKGTEYIVDSTDDGLDVSPCTCRFCEEGKDPCEEL